MTLNNENKKIEQDASETNIISSGEEHIDQMDFVKINSDKMTEGRIYVIETEKPENYTLCVVLGLLTKITSVKDLKFTLLDNHCIRSNNVGQLLKTGLKLTSE